MSPQDLKAEKLTAIYHALLTLLADRPMQDISVTVLCRQAGVSRTYFYRTFGNFDAIISQYQQRAIVTYLRRSPGQVPLLLAELMTHYFEYVQHSADQQRLLLKSGRMMVLLQTFQSAFLFLLEHDRILKSPLLMDPYYVAFLSGAVINLSVTWLQAGMPEPPQYMGQRIAKFTLHRKD